MMKFYKTHRLKKGTSNKNAHAVMHQIIQQSTEGQIFTMQTFQIPDNSFRYVTGNTQGWSESKRGLLLRQSGGEMPKSIRSNTLFRAPHQ